MEMYNVQNRKMCIYCMCRNIFCKLDVLLYDENINKVYFALYVSACC